MVTSEILYRVFRIRYGNDVGTAFTVEKDNVQYIVTAKHIIENVKSGELVTIEVLLSGKYHPISAIVKFHSNLNVDCAVLKTIPYIEVTSKFSNENAVSGITLGQDAYFIGFPYNYDEILQNFPQSSTPVPFVKKACVSGLSKSEEEHMILFLDGINNPGFSGGPVCFKDSKTNKFKIAGVINSYTYNRNPVFVDEETETKMFVKENTGIINVCCIEAALKIIDSF